MATSPASAIPDNLQPLKLTSVRQPDQPEDLQVLYDELMARLEEVIRWYEQHKHHHKRRATLLRGLGIALAGIASVVPIAVSMLPFAWQPQRWVPLASILAALGAGCIGLDRLFGYSASWMRYVTALLELQGQRELLQFHWTRRALEARVAAGAPGDRLAANLDLIYTARLAINKVLKDETQEWVVRFSGALQDFEKSVAAQRSASESAAASLGAGAVTGQGALKVQIAGFDQLEDTPCEIQLGDEPADSHHGATKAFTRLIPGQYVLRVSARRAGKRVSTEEVVTVQAGETATVTVTLA